MSPFQAPISDSKKRLALAIIDFLSTSLKDGTLASEDAESIEVAQSCIADTFHVDPSDQTAMKDAIGGQSLLSIYGVFEKLKGKSTANTTSAGANGSPQSAASSATGNSKAAAPSPSSTPANAEAEAFKSQGNAALQRKEYPAAIEFYGKAIALSPTNPIYLSNRAAAYSACHKHSEAQTDAEMAVAADPKYTKAWSRLGLARFVLGDVKGSVEAYGKGIEYEGNGGSEAMKKGYKTAKERLEQEEQENEKADEEIDEVESARGSGAGAGAAGGMPDLSALAGMLGGGRGGGGGGPDLSSIMSNPMFASMAQNLMSNPDAMNNIMNNPQLKQMAQNFGLGGGGGGESSGGGGGSGGGAPGGGAGRGSGGGGGGGGGMPDLASLMQDPSIAEL